MEIPAAQREKLLDAARESIKRSLRGEPLVFSASSIEDPVLNVAAGCFVTLHDRSSRRLRGCIGRMQSNDPLWKSVQETACSTLQDPRFRSNPVTLAELPRLELEISVLSPLTAAAHVLDFDPAEDGIYLICEGRTGTFLPQVARETGWGREQLLSRLCTEKMGLMGTAWQGAGARLLKYRVLVIGPEPFVKPAMPTGESGSVEGPVFGV